MSWKTVRLGDICNTASGGTPSRANDLYWNGNIPWLKSGELNDGLVSDVEEYISEEGLKNSSAKLVKKGTLLLALYGATAGKLGILDFDSSTNQALCAITPIDQKIDSHFLMKYLLFKREKIVKDSIGGAQPNISQAYVRNLQIPLPPLSTQKQISSILDKADALRQQYRQLLNYYDELLQSTFIEMFGDPVKNTKGWEVRTCQDLILKIDAGSSFGGEEREMSESELGVLKISAVTSGYFRATEYKAVPISLINDNLIFPKKGDLLFSRANTRELVAATCIVHEDCDRVFLPDKLWRISLDLDKCNPHYFKFLLSQNELRSSLTKTATGTSGSMLNISMAKLRCFELPVAPIELQNKFAIIFDKVEEQKKLVQAALGDTESTFNSLLSSYFKK